jgi:hypothetical protein
MLNVPDDSLGVEAGALEGLLPEVQVGRVELVEGGHVDLGTSEVLIALALLLTC